MYGRKGRTENEIKPNNQSISLKNGREVRGLDYCQKDKGHRKRENGYELDHGSMCL